MGADWTPLDGAAIDERNVGVVKRPEVRQVLAPVRALLADAAGHRVLSELNVRLALLENCRPLGW